MFCLTLVLLLSLMGLLGLGVSLGLGLGRGSVGVVHGVLEREGSTVWVSGSTGGSGLVSTSASTLGSSGIVLLGSVSLGSTLTTEGSLGRSIISLRNRNTGGGILTGDLANVTERQLIVLLGRSSALASLVMLLRSSLELTSALEATTSTTTTVGHTILEGIGKVCASSSSSLRLTAVVTLGLSALLVLRIGDSGQRGEHDRLEHGGAAVRCQVL